MPNGETNWEPARNPAIARFPLDPLLSGSVNFTNFETADFFPQLPQPPASQIAMIRRMSNPFVSSWNPLSPRPKTPGQRSSRQVVATLIHKTKLLRVRNSLRCPLLRLPAETIGCRFDHMATGNLNQIDRLVFKRSVAESRTM